MLVHFKVIWYILWPFVNVEVIWYIFPVFGTLCLEKSGNPEVSPNDVIMEEFDFREKSYKNLREKLIVKSNGYNKYCIQKVVDTKSIE
jgi:hypothetical protein